MKTDNLENYVENIALFNTFAAGTQLFYWIFWIIIGLIIVILVSIILFTIVMERDLLKYHRSNTLLWSLIIILLPPIGGISYFLYTWNYRRSKKY